MAYGVDAARDFHLGVGGPIDSLLERRRLGARQVVLGALVLAWGPLIVLALIEWLAGGRVEPMMRDASTHTRVLIAIPIFILASRFLDRACRQAIRQLFDEHFLARHDEVKLRRLLEYTTEQASSASTEIALLILAYAASVGVLLDLFRLPGAGQAVSRQGPISLWYALVSLPMFQFLLWRSLFRWGLWTRVLLGLARMRLRLRPTHGDQRGGLGFLKLPSLGYGVFLLLASSSVLCGAWGTEILRDGLRIDAVKPLFTIFAAVGLLVALGPMLLFAPRLLAARRAGREQVGALMSDYAERFEDRWLRGRSHGLPDDMVLGSADFQAMADLGTTLRVHVEEMRILLFDARDLAALAAAALLPTLPLLLTQVPARELFVRVAHLVLGGS